VEASAGESPAQSDRAAAPKAPDEGSDAERAAQLERFAKATGTVLLLILLGLGLLLASGSVSFR
jgi:hypothetical protein